MSRDDMRQCLQRKALPVMIIESSRGPATIRPRFGLPTKNNPKTYEKILETRNEWAYSIFEAAATAEKSQCLPSSTASKCPLSAPEEMLRRASELTWV